MSSGGLAHIKPESLAKNIELMLSGFKVTGQDLISPTKELVIAYYTGVMQEFGVDFGPSYCIQDVTHSLKLYHIVAYVFSKLGIQKFSFDDINNPASKGTLRLFAILHNFHSFADEQAHEVSMMREKRVARMTVLHNLTRTKNELLEKENEQAVHRATRLEQGRQLQNHMVELKATKITAVEKQHQLSEATETIEGKLASAKNNVDKLATSVSHMDEELSQLDRRIVIKSPEELQQEVAALQAVVSSLEDDRRVQNSGLQQKMERIGSLETELSTLKESSNGLEQAWAQQCEEKQMSAALQGVQQETDSVEAAYKLMNQQLRAEKKERTKLQKLHDKSKQDFSKKTQEFQDELEVLKKEFEEFRKSQENMDVEFVNIGEKILDTASKKEEEIEAIKMEHKEVEEAYERYKLLVKSFAEEILKGVKNMSVN